MQLDSDILNIGIALLYKNCSVKEIKDSAITNTFAAIRYEDRKNKIHNYIFEDYSQIQDYIELNTDLQSNFKIHNLTQSKIERFLVDDDIFVYLISLLDTKEYRYSKINKKPKLILSISNKDNLVSIKLLDEKNPEPLNQSKFLI